MWSDNADCGVYVKPSLNYQYLSCLRQSNRKVSTNDKLPEKMEVGITTPKTAARRRHSVSSLPAWKRSFRRMASLPGIERGGEDIKQGHVARKYKVSSEHSTFLSCCCRTFFRLLLLLPITAPPVVVVVVVVVLYWMLQPTLLLFVTDVSSWPLLLHWMRFVSFHSR